MLLTQQFEAIISHAVSQLCYRWLSVSYALNLNPKRVHLAHLTLDDWLTYIDTRLRDDLDAPWKRLVQQKSLSPIGLATVIYSNNRQIQGAYGHVVDYFHSSYPHLLKHIPDAPAALSILGSLNLLDKSKIAIVGSRKASSYALKASRKLAQKFVDRGQVVVSGGAIGCDAAAHYGALDSQQIPVPTIVVFAGGLSQFYPACNRELFGRLRERGAAFVSERLWDFPARPKDFPVRNRIIAGLCSELVVAQAAERSGALKTAHFALEQGRDVYALEHEVDDIRAFGSKRLLEDGAIPLPLSHGLGLEP